MALDERDYMRDRIRHRDSYTERSTFRRSYAGEKDYRYFPKMFRGQTTEGSSSTGEAFWRTLVICLAVYGALAGVRDLRTLYDKKQTAIAAIALKQEREQKERVWSLYYQQPEYCKYAAGPLLERCQRERADARRQFELSYAANQR